VPNPKNIFLPLDTIYARKHDNTENDSRKPTGSVIKIDPGIFYPCFPICVGRCVKNIHADRWLKETAKEKRLQKARRMEAAMRITSWAVLTGAPSSGKTSVILDLAERGFRVVHEVARAYIEELLKTGLGIEEIKADELAFERSILHRKIAIESGLPDDETIFLDRAVPDSIAYFEAANLDPAEPLERSRLVRYRRVFLLERLPFEKDRVRSENVGEAEKLDRLLRRSYERLGYDPVFVPAIPVKERTEFILERLRADGFSPRR
jgi:predicted ATPase